MHEEIETLSPPEFKRFLLERRPMNAVRRVMARTEKGGLMIVEAARANKKGEVTGEVWNGENHMPIQGKIFVMIDGVKKFLRQGFVTIYFDRIVEVQVNKNLVLERE